MTRLGWTGSLFMVLGLVLGVAIGWGLARAVPAGPGQIIQVARVPPYKPVEIVPGSADWPEGDPVVVATVTPPTKKEARKLERDFGFRLDRTSVLGRFDLPDLPDGGQAVVSVPVSDRPDPVSLTVKANPPPLVRVRWSPTFEVWYGFGGGPVSGDSWSSYLSLRDLACARDRVCMQVRAGREVRPWADGWVAEVGLSVRF